MTNQSKMIGAIVGAVIQAVVVLAVGVPIIQSASFQPQDVENDPLAYTVYMNGDSMSTQAFAVTSQGGIKTTYQNIDYDVQTQCTSLLISDGINAVINGTAMDIYCPDGKLYASQTSITKDADSTSIAVTDAGGNRHTFDLPTYCYLNVGKSDAAKSVQTNGIFKTNDKTILDGSSSLVLVGLTDGIMAVSGQSTVTDMAQGVEGGIIIDPATGKTSQATSKATESEADVGGNHKGYNIDDGTISGVVA